MYNWKPKFKKSHLQQNQKMKCLTINLTKHTGSYAENNKMLMKKLKEDLNK